MENTKIIKVVLDEKAKDELREIYEDITEYDNPQYNRSVAIFDDGTVSAGDLHINNNSRSEWHEKPLISFSVYPVYTTAEIEGCGDDPDDDKVSEAWAAEAKSAILLWVDSFTEKLEAGIEYIEETDDVYEMIGKPRIVW